MLTLEEVLNQYLILRARKLKRKISLRILLAIVLLLSAVLLIANSEKASLLGALLFIVAFGWFFAIGPLLRYLLEIRSIRSLGLQDILKQLEVYGDVGVLFHEIETELPLSYAQFNFWDRRKYPFFVTDHWVINLRSLPGQSFIRIDDISRLYGRRQYNGMYSFNQNYFVAQTVLNETILIPILQRDDLIKFARHIRKQNPDVLLEVDGAPGVRAFFRGVYESAKEEY